MVSYLTKAVLVCAAISAVVTAASAAETRRLTVSEYRDKMQGGWLGQMAGVGWGGPTEFRYLGKTIPEAEVPVWQPKLINQFDQDDIYVELTFLQTLERNGLKVSARKAAIDFANSGFSLWHANRFGRDNVRAGIAPPDSGHPRFSRHSDDIDYQIEADFSGLVAPGMPNTVIALGDKFGRIVNYGDGLYAGVFVGAMYAEAFFEKDPARIVEKALKSIPAESQYAEMVRDVIAWHRANPGDWTKTWQLAEDKYGRNPEYNRYSCSKRYNIDAKINGAYIVMGLLYGAGDPDKTIVVSMRCGQDSDCNPSNAAGVLFTSIGRAALPAKFTSALDTRTTYSYSGYNWDTLCAATEKIARQAVASEGGRIERTTAGSEVFVIPVREPRLKPVERSWQPGPIANARLTAAERRLVKHKSIADEMKPMIAKIAPGWALFQYDHDLIPAIKEMRGRKDTFRTHPIDQQTPCVWARETTLKPGSRAALRIAAGTAEGQDWTMVVRVEGEELVRLPMDETGSPNGWRDIEVDLSEYAGSKVLLEVQHWARGWNDESAHWAGIDLVERSASR